VTLPRNPEHFVVALDAGAVIEGLPDPAWPRSGLLPHGYQPVVLADGMFVCPGSRITNRRVNTCVAQRPVHLRCVCAKIRPGTNKTATTASAIRGRNMSSDEQASGTARLPTWPSGKYHGRIGPSGKDRATFTDPSSTGICLSDRGLRRAAQAAGISHSAQDADLTEAVGWTQDASKAPPRPDPPLSRLFCGEHSRPPYLAQIRHACCAVGPRQPIRMRLDDKAI